MQESTFWHTEQDFIDVRGYPEWITVTRVLDGGETPLFKQYFSDWHDDNETVAPHPDNREEQTGNNVARKNQNQVSKSLFSLAFCGKTHRTIHAHKISQCEHLTQKKARVLRTEEVIPLVRLSLVSSSLPYRLILSFYLYF